MQAETLAPRPVSIYKKSLASKTKRGILSVKNPQRRPSNG